MICPQTKAKCGHLAYCDITGKCLDQLSAELDKTDAEIRNSIAVAMQAPPTLAEIERLVDALEDTVRTDGYMGCERRLNREARAALMAAIQRHIQKT